jgi:hypothetical protein
MPQLIRGMQEMNCDAMRSAFKRGSIGRIPCPLFVALPLHQKLDIGFGHSQLKGYFDSIEGLLSREYALPNLREENSLGSGNNI